MRRELPVRPSLEHLKSQAKDLLEALRRREPDALARVRDALPAARGADDAKLAAMGLALHDAQSVIAREYGFPSWAELRAHVEAATTTTTATMTAAAPQGPSPEQLRALMGPHLGVALPAQLQEALVAIASEPPKLEGLALPSSLPLVPLRNALLTVGAVAPLSIGRPSTIAAVEAARQAAGHEPLVAVFSQKDDANESPGEADLHPVGCVARLARVVPTADRGVFIVVKGVAWARLDAIEQREPYVRVRVVPFELAREAGPEVTELETALRERVRGFAARLPDPARIVKMADSLDAAALADLALANVTCSVQDKARYASEPSLRVRLAYLLTLLDRAA